MYAFVCVCIYIYKLYIYVCIHGYMIGYMDTYGGFFKWGIPKSPWVSILSHGLMTWMIGGTPILGRLHMVVGQNDGTRLVPKNHWFIDGYPPKAGI